MGAVAESLLALIDRAVRCGGHPLRRSPQGDVEEHEEEQQEDSPEPLAPGDEVATTPTQSAAMAATTPRRTARRPSQLPGSFRTLATTPQVTNSSMR